jgi:hypothetical protein
MEDEPNKYLTPRALQKRMSVAQPIDRELSVGEVISKTFELYRRNFAKYFVIYLIIDAITGIATFLALNSLVLGSLPSNPTSQQVSDYFTSEVVPFFAFLLAIVVVSIVLGALAEGASVKMASDDMKSGQASLSSSIRFVGSRLLGLIALQILVSIIVGLGFVALIVPGVILAIMFSLAFPSLLIEGIGVTGSLGRSRELVSHRWGKTFVIGLVLGLIILVLVVVALLISLPFGYAYSLVSSIVGSLYGPLLPIAMTVYYYSNLARVTPSQAGQTTVPTVPGAQVGMKYCSNCGTQMAAGAIYCPKCGIRQVP